jgi:hypothetical protein
MNVRRVQPLPFSAFPDLMSVLDGRRTGDGIPQLAQLEVGDAELRFEPEDVFDQLGELQSMEQHLPIVYLPRDVMEQGDALPHLGVPGIEIDTLKVALILSDSTATALLTSAFACARNWITTSRCGGVCPR